MLLKIGLPLQQEFVVLQLISYLIYYFQCAALVMRRILQSEIKNIQEEEILRKIYLDNGSCMDWRSPSCFKQLAMLLKSSYYRYSALSGFIISAGKYIDRHMGNILFLDPFSLGSKFLGVFALLFSNSGGVTESTMRGACDALLSVISDIRELRQVSLKRNV